MSFIEKIFRRRYCNSCTKVKFYRNKYYECNKELLKIKKANKNATELIEKFKNAVSNNEIILSVTSEYFITLKQTFDFYGTLRYLEFRGYFKTNFSDSSPPPRLWVSAEKDQEDRYVKSFYIIDFLCEPNKGYGSVLMNEFLEYIHQFGAEFVSGFLSFVDTQDKEHKERLYHFYKKFGFEIDSQDNIKLPLINISKK